MVDVVCEEAYTATLVKELAPRGLTFELAKVDGPMTYHTAPIALESHQHICGTVGIEHSPHRRNNQAARA
jgi:hypothetical protein